MSGDFGRLRVRRVLGLYRWFWGLDTMFLMNFLVAFPSFFCWRRKSCQAMYIIPRRELSTEDTNMRRYNQMSFDTFGKT